MARFLTLDERDRAALSASIEQMLPQRLKHSPYAEAAVDDHRVTILQSMRIWMVSVHDLREAAQDGRDMRHIARETHQVHHQLSGGGEIARRFATSVSVEGREHSVSAVADGDLAQRFERALAQMEGLDLPEWEMCRLRVPQLRTEVLWARGPGEMPDYTCLLTTMLSLPSSLNQLHSSLELIAALAQARSIENWSAPQVAAQAARTDSDEA